MEVKAHAGNSRNVNEHQPYRLRNPRRAINQTMDVWAYAIAPPTVSETAILFNYDGTTTNNLLLCLNCYQTNTIKLQLSN